MVKLHYQIRISVVVLVLILGAASALSITQGCRNALRYSGDFSMRWFSAKVILKGENPYRMLLNRSPSGYARQLLSGGRVYFYAPELPSGLIVIMPYAFMPFDMAVKGWLITNIIAAAVLLFCVLFMLSETRAAPIDYILISSLFLSGMAFRNALGLGQTSLVAFTFFVLSLIASDKGRWFASGVLLALSLVKCAVILPFLIVFYLLRKRWRPLIICGVIHIGAHVFLCMLMKTSPLLFFNDIFQLSLRFFEWGGINIWTWLTCRSEGTAWLKNYIAILFFLYTAFLTLTISLNTNNNRLGLLSIVSVFALLSVSHRLYDAVCLIFPLLWIALFKDFKILRFLIGAGIIYCFFIYRILRYMGAGSYICDLTAFICLCVIFYAISKVLHAGSRHIVLPAKRRAAC